MRFYLDHDVPLAVRQVPEQQRHECWTAGEAGLATATDEVQAIYAEEKRAILVSMDRGFAMRQRRNTVGRHVWLDCEGPDAAHVLENWMTAIGHWLRFSQRTPWVRVRPNGFMVQPGRWE